MLDVHFDEPAVAKAFLAELRARQFNAEMSVDVFAGEDDLDDAARIVHVAAEPGDIAELIETYDGWVVASRNNIRDRIGDAPELPRGPRRFK